MDEQKALSMLGLAMRAGQVQSGDMVCERAVRASRAILVLLDADASGSTKARYRELCDARGICLYMISPGALGRAIGKEGRMVAALGKGKLAERIDALLAGSAARP